MDETPLEELPGLIGELAAAQAVAMARLTTPTPTNGNRQAAEPELLLTPAAAVEAIGGDLSRKWLLRHTKGLRFRRDYSRKVIRFEKPGLLRWAAARRA